MPTIIETFVGCGGSHLGFKRSGFQPIFINDINPSMMETVLANDNACPHYIGDIRDISKKSIEELQESPLPDIDVLMGGIVCKGFSLAGNRNPCDPRNQLYKEQLRLVQELKPKISILENVPQFKTTFILDPSVPNELISQLHELYEKKKQLNGQRTNSENYGRYTDSYEQLKLDIQSLEQQCKEYSYCVFDHIHSLYEELGYRVTHRIVNCADYGDFTCRRRLFIVAIREDIVREKGDFQFPEPLYTPSTYKTVQDALNTIDSQGINHPSVDINNVPMKHAPNTVERFSYIPEGKSLKDIHHHLPDHLRTKGTFSSRGSCKRLDRNKSCPTLVPGHSAFPIHPEYHRSLTIREGAVITGFPNDYIFVGSHTKKCEQIGNAIPVQTATVLAKQIRNYLE